MFTFFLVLTIVNVTILVIAAAMQPASQEVSAFELRRRASAGDETATAKLRRLDHTTDVMSVMRIKVALLLVMSVLLLITTFGWVFGTILAVLIALEYGTVARIGFVRRFADKLFIPVEDFWLRVADTHPQVFVFFRSVSPQSPEPILGSRQELQHLVDSSHGVLTHDEQKLIMHGLSFRDLLVSSVMTPKSMIQTIHHSDFLGPLRLDELHKQGHSRLPVINGDIDHVVGVLHLQSLLMLDVKRSVTAEKAMEPRVYYIKHDQSLHHALAAFLRTHHHLFIVVNEYRETVGLLTLEDVIEALLGQRIVDEFDGHEDLRSVALRNPHDNNEPKNHVDV